MRSKYGRLITFAAFAAALVVHYLVYAYRFMWYLNHEDFRQLMAIYLVFVIIASVEVVFAPKWWVMAPTAFLAMVAPAVSDIHYHVPVGLPFLLIAALSASQFAGVAFVRNHGRAINQY